MEHQRHLQVTVLQVAMDHLLAQVDLEGAVRRRRVMELLVAALAEVVHRHRLTELLPAALEVALEEAVLLRLVTRLPVVDSEVEVVVMLPPLRLPLTTELQVVEVVVLLQVMVHRLHLLQIMGHRLHLLQVMGLPQIVLEVQAFLLRVTQLLAMDSVEVLLLLVTVHRPLLHLVMELQIVVEEAMVELRVTQLLTMDSVEVLLLLVTAHRPLLHLVMELQIVEEEATAELLLRVTQLPQFLLTMFLLLLHRVMVLHQHRLPAMGHQRHRHTDHRRRPECMVLPNSRHLRLPVTEHHQYLPPATDLLAFPPDRTAAERIQLHRHHREVTRLLQHLPRVTARLLPVHTVEDFLHIQTRPLAPLERLEVALLHRVTGRPPDHQATMVLRVEVLSAMAVLLPVLTVLQVLLVHRLKTTVYQQRQLIQRHLQPTEHQLLHLDHTHRQVRTMELLLYLLEVTEPQHVGRQGHQDISALPIISLKEVRLQGVTQCHQL